MIHINACGNIFAILTEKEWKCIENRTNGESNEPDALFLWEPYFGAGGHMGLFEELGIDSALVLSPGSHGSAVKMRICEPDGSQSNMCGNGLLSVAHVLRTSDISSVETRLGIHRFEHFGQKTIAEVGPFRYHGTGRIGGRTVHFSDVFEPHAVLFLERDDFEKNGSEILERFGGELSLRGRSGTTWNFSIAFRESDSAIRARTFERGVGRETGSCGTGASCIANLASRTGIPASRIRVAFSWGTILVETGEIPRISHAEEIRIIPCSQFLHPA